MDPSLIGPSEYIKTKIQSFPQSTDFADFSFKQQALPLADLGVGGGGGRAPPRFKMFSISCSYILENLVKLHVGTPSYGESWIYLHTFLELRQFKLYKWVE